MKKNVFLVAVIATMMVSCTPKQASTETSSVDSVKVDSCLHDTCSQITDSVK